MTSVKLKYHKLGLKLPLVHEIPNFFNAIRMYHCWWEGGAIISLKFPFRNGKVIEYQHTVRMIRSIVDDEYYSVWGYRDTGECRSFICDKGGYSTNTAKTWRFPEEY